MKKNKPRRLGWILLLILCPILIGEFFLSRTLRDYREYDLISQDQALEIAMDSVDNTIDYICRDYIEELEYLTGQHKFLDAEADWLQTGDAHDLYIRLKENFLARDEMVRSFVMAYKGKVLLSSDGNTDYWLQAGEENKSEETHLEINICADLSLQPYIAIIQYRGNLSYALIMEPEVLYRKAEDISGLRSVGDMILLDRESSMFMYRDGQSIKAELLTDEGQMEDPLLQILLYGKMKKNASVDFYDVKESKEKEAFQARVAVRPDVNTRNGVFTIGIIHDAQPQQTMIRKTAVRIVIFAGMILAGIMLLLYRFLQFYRQDEINQKEIEVLRAKKDAMEALNRQTKELAHHQRLETIGQMTSGIAHEFNNLLTPIMGYSIMTMEALPPEDTESYDNLLEIYEAANKAKQLVLRLSDLSRKNTAATMHSIQPNELVNRTLAMVKTGKPKPIRIETDLKCTDETIYGNETQLTQMLINLVLNAFHAIGDEEGTVTISDYVEKGYVCIRVQDTGKGMSEEVQEKIFEPFFTTKEQGKGTGLGLAIAMQTVEEHKGAISVRSKEGQGSSFTVWLPIQ